MSIASSEFLFRALVVLAVFLWVKCHRVLLESGFRSVLCIAMYRLLFLSLVPCLFTTHLSSWGFCIRLHEALSGPISKPSYRNDRVDLLLQKLLE